LWLHGLGHQLAGVNAAALDAEDALRQLKSRKWSAERVIAVLADVVTAASPPNSPPPPSATNAAHTPSPPTTTAQSGSPLSHGRTPPAESKTSTPSHPADPWKSASLALITTIVHMIERCVSTSQTSSSGYSTTSPSNAQSQRSLAAPASLHRLNSTGLRMQFAGPRTVHARSTVQLSQLHSVMVKKHVSKSYARLVASRAGSDGPHPAGSIEYSTHEASPPFEAPNVVPPSLEASLKGPLIHADSMASLASLAANAAPPTMSTLNAFMNDDFDDGTIELNQYVLFEKIGQGAQGEVFLANDSTKNELRAIKAVRRPRGAKGPASPNTSTAVGAVAAARQRQRDQLEREVLAMKKLRHRNVVRLYEVIDDPELDRMYLVMQYVEHGPVVTLTPEGVASKTIDPKKMVSYARQICAGLEYLHKKGVIHRDIKPDNILLGRDDCVYLADFGTAEVFGEADAQRGVTGTRGTMAFLAPELLASLDDGSKDLLEWSANEGPGAPDGADSPVKALKVSGEAVDVWALGVTFYVMLYGKLPWEFDDARQLFKHIESSPISFSDLVAAPSSVASNIDFSVNTARNNMSGTASPRPFHSVRQDVELAAFDPNTADASNLDLDSEGDLDDTTPSAPQLMTPKQYISIGHEWRRVLGGMLERVPARRSTVRDVRRKLAGLAHVLSMVEKSTSEYEAITTVRRRSSEGSAGGWIN
jgi:serine/threonine protein kinase